MVKMIEEGRISTEQAKSVFTYILEEEKTPEEIVKEKGLEQISDPEEIRKLVNEVIDNNPKELESYKSGKTNLIGFFIGQTLKLSEGKANPSLVNKIISEEISKR